ncbi:MAG TPA: 1-deoxy-D-xylulose-5-phosphate synthase [Propionibacteriaceae bacterium]|nr:1-deoxy-D-xylulose-5-phosphate synthase [Propionibacteriaceae bacterium]
MSLLERISDPAALRRLDRAQLDELASEIRAFLVSNVSRTGGHLGPNLGVVELTIALHRVFDSPQDPIVFDTGHQSYVHKILTGRRALFPTLRQQHGLSGYPCRSESEHDWVESSHASAALSWADGMAKAFRLRGESDRTVVAVVGDGSLTGGMVWEALNNIADDPDLPLVVVVNDNGRSYTPTVGGIANQLSAMRTDKRYEPMLQMIKTTVSNTPIVGKPAYDLLHGLKSGIKDVLAPQGLFSDLGMKYLGPIDGHDVGALEVALTRAKRFGGPVIVHCITVKGRGFKAAEDHDEDRFHSVGRIDERTGEPLTPSMADTWTDVFSDELVRLAAHDERLVAITAAMLHPTGLGAFQTAYPSRTFDVGIAEQHAVASAAGLAMAGLHPVVALYSTFLNRAFDQLLMDVALHKLGVTLVLDRGGVTGPDGPSHHGVWDHTIAALVPGLRLAEPRDGRRLREALAEAVAVDDAPTVIRYSKERMPEEIPAVRTVGDVDLLAAPADPRVLVVGYGQLVGMALDVGHRLSQQGIAATVVDPVWALPVSPALVELACDHELVVTLEDAVVGGGLGAQLSAVVADSGKPVVVRQFGIGHEFLPQGSRDQVLEVAGVTAQAVARAAIESLVSHDVEKAPSTTPTTLGLPPTAEV